jgi:hypothetical protein
VQLPDEICVLHAYNSARLIDVSIELQKLTPDMTRGQVDKTQLQPAIEKLDAIYWAFLKDNLKDYLKDKKQTDSFWKKAEDFAPAPVADAFEPLARKGNPTAKDVRESLQKALAKLKAP